MRGFYFNSVGLCYNVTVYREAEMDIDLDKLDLDIDEAAPAEKIEAKLQADEVEIEAINDCESGACAI